MSTGRMPPSTALNPAAPATDTAAAATAANYARLQQWIEKECGECDGAITEHRQQVADYRNQKAKLEELQKNISHPIMVPFGSVGFMPGKLVRTNEVLVLLGSNYFAECSVHDTGKIIDRRIREIKSIVDKLEQQKRNAQERLNFAQGLFGGATGEGGKDGMIEIREEYDEEKEKEARRKRAERAAAAREARRVPEKSYESMMSRLDELEEQEERAGERSRVVESLDSDDELEVEMEDTVEERKEDTVEEKEEEGEREERSEEEEKEQATNDDQEMMRAYLGIPKGVNVEEYKRLLARLDQLEGEDSSGEEESDAILEEEEEEDSESDNEDSKRAGLVQLRQEKEAEERRKMREREEKERRAAQQPQPAQQQKPRRFVEVIEDDDAPSTVPPPPATVHQHAQIPKMTVVSENDRVVDLVEYQSQQEDEEDKAKENSPTRKGLAHKRSVRFKKNLEAGPCEKSFESLDDVLPTIDPQVKSILRNKSEESPIDKIAFSEMEDQRSTTILPAGNAFSGCVVERAQASSELPIVFKPADEPPRRVSRFKLQRMQQATD